MKTLIVLCVLFMFGCATTGKPDPNVVRVVYEKSRGEHVMDFVKIGFQIALQTGANALLWRQIGDEITDNFNPGTTQLIGGTFDWPNQPIPPGQ